MPIGSNQIAGITILAVVISFIGAIQLMFQQSIHTAIEQVNKGINGSYRNFVAINEAEKQIQNQTRVLNKLLVDRTAMFTQLQNSTDTILEKIESEKPQSNFTAQANYIRESTEDFEDLKDDINIIKGSILSLDNKVNELFFLENKTPIRPDR